MRQRTPYHLCITRLSDGVFIETDKGFAASLGHKRKKLTGRSALASDLNFWPGPKERALFIAEVKKRGELTEWNSDLWHHNAVLSFAKIFRIGGEDCLLSVFRDVTACREENPCNCTYQEKLKELSSQLSLVEEKERRRIAAAIHDYIGQSLAFAHLKLQSLGEMPLSGEARTLLNEANTMVELCLQYARSITFDLSPTVLYELGFEAAVEWQVDQMQGQYGITYRIKTGGDFSKMANEIRIILFRAVRELLANVVKHAKAHRVLITLRRRGARAVITILDDGIGFREGASRSSKGFGLFSLREQLSYIGGSMSIGSLPGRGTSVTIDAPLRQSGGGKNR